MILLYALMTLRTLPSCTQAAEAGEVELAQRALSYADVDGVTAGFLLVRRKVLDVCKRALFLNALDEFRRKLRRQAGSSL